MARPSFVRCISLSLFLCSTALSSGARAQTELPEIVVYATQVPQEATRVGAAVSVVTGEELRARGTTTVADALRDIPGLAIGQSGSRGGLTEVRARGGEANHLLVLIDGMAVNGVDNGNFNFADLNVDDIARIEVIRGPQSGLYGANAHTGVIAITTVSGKGRKPSASIKLEGGTPGAWGAAATASGSQGPVYGALTLSNNATQGFNIARTGTERDGGRAFVATAKAGIDINPNLNIEGSLRYTDRFAESDPQDFTFGSPTYGLVIDGRDTNDFQSLAGRIAANLSLLDGRWKQSLYATHFREDYAFFDSIFNVTSPFEGTRSSIGYKSSYSFDTPALFGVRHTVTGGIEHERERFAGYGAAATRAQLGVYGEWLMDFANGFSFGAALRHDDFDGFEDATTFRLTAVQRIESTGTKLRASVGSAITKPTFTEMFGFFPNFIPNPNLTPERSLGFDIGIDQTLLDGRLRLSATYFNSRLKNEIITVYSPVPPFSYSPDNAAGASTRQGIELSGAADILPWLTLAATYTYTDAIESALSPNPVTAGQREIRRPPHTGSISATARFADDKGRVTVAASYQGTSPDLFFGTFPATRVDLPADWRVNAQLSYDWSKTLNTYIRAENVFNSRKEEVFSYRNPGFTALAGIRVKFGE